jgi:hypothetical protein
MLPRGSTYTSSNDIMLTYFFCGEYGVKCSLICRDLAEFETETELRAGGQLDVVIKVCIIFAKYLVWDQT